MLDIIAYVIFSLIIGGLAIDSVRMRVRRKKIIASVAKLTFDNTILAGQLEKALSAQEEKSIEQTEGFLKFVSDSRDWAFQYIEQVQEEIYNLGQVIEESKDDSSAIERILAANAELQKLLPDNKEDKKFKEN
jgi:hypothetical protein